MPLPKPEIIDHDGFHVVRDDLLPGGTKRRGLTELLNALGADEYIYPSTAQGYGPVALAHACRDLGKKATLIY